MTAMRLARVDDGFELGVGEEPPVIRFDGTVGRYEGFGGATEAIAADCTSGVGCGFAPKMRTDWRV